MLRLRRWTMALVITLMLIDAWMGGAAAAMQPRPDRGPGDGETAARP